MKCNSPKEEATKAPTLIFPLHFQPQIPVVICPNLPTLTQPEKCQICDGDDVYCVCNFNCEDHLKPFCSVCDGNDEFCMCVYDVLEDDSSDESDDENDNNGGDENRAKLSCNLNVDKGSSRMIVVGDGYTIEQSLCDHMQAKLILSNPQDKRPFILKNHYFCKKKAVDVTICKDAIAIFEDPNAGGNSVNGEGFSMEMLNQLYGAHSVVTEMRVDYWQDNWKKVDFIFNLAGNNNNNRVGVSVTRAMGHPDPVNFNLFEAEQLLHRKLENLVVARCGTTKKDSFKYSILHVWCQNDRIADLILDVWNAMPTETKDNIFVLLSVTSIPYIFYDKLDKSLITKYCANQKKYR